MQGLAREEIEAIVKEMVEKQVSAAILEYVRRNEDRARELSLVERVIRVEEELKALREIEAARFDAAEKRFEAMEKRFEAMEKRFEAMEKRFEAMDKRFEAMEKRFEAMDKRFEAIDTRFEALQREMEVRFTALDKRLLQVQWLIGLGLGLITLLIGLLRFAGGVSF